MNFRSLLISLGAMVLATAGLTAETKVLTPGDAADWQVHNRHVTRLGEEIHLDAAEGDGILWRRDVQFGNGTIELDIKGRDVRGQSFVGIVFHGHDNQTFEGIYFRPFNFRSPERKTHAVQYISMPDHDWSVLRNAHPDVYENELSPAPDPNEWFHARIVIKSPQVSVFVNGETEPSLVVEQLSDRGTGDFGLWAGNGSDAQFRNVKLTPSD